MASLNISAPQAALQRDMTELQSTVTQEAVAKVPEDVAATGGGVDLVALEDPLDPRAYIGRPVSELPSPSFVVNKTKVAENCKRMRDKCAKEGVSLRAHVKTHKTIQAARLMFGDDARFPPRIVVSTLAEAYHFARAGFEDILYGVLVSESKLPRLQPLLKAVPKFHLLVDSIQMVEALEKDATDRGVQYSVFVKVDCGYGRAGMPAASPELVAVVGAVHAATSVTLAGLYSHSGDGYTVGGNAAAVAERECQLLAQAAHAAGITIPTLSVGSTPTCTQAADWHGVTEVHPGNYAFMDRQQYSLGSCGPDDIASYVVGRVIGVYPARNELLLDVGGLALHKDLGGLTTWGEIIGHPELKLTRITQEACVVECAAPINFADFPRGTMVKILPNHACMTAAAHPHYYVEDGSGIVVDVWTPVKFW